MHEKFFRRHLIQSKQENTGVVTKATHRGGNSFHSFVRMSKVSTWEPG